MSVLIENMEMPFTCLTCDFHKCAGGVGDFCSITKRRQFRFKNRPKDCPLIEVPEPHGRLGDLDALPWYLANTSVKYATYEDWEMLCDAIAAAPTVIPASEEG